MKKNKIIINIFLIVLIISICEVLLAMNIKTISPDKNYTNEECAEESILEEIEPTKEEIIGFLTINKIDLKAKVKKGSDSKTLENYIGIIGNNIYDGNVSFAAHNRGYKNSYFARLNELQINDEVIYENKYFCRTYKVTNIKVIRDTDTFVLENSQENQLTLITCVADKPEQRLCVQALAKN